MGRADDHLQPPGHHLFAFLVLAALMAALRYTTLGLRTRAVTQNRRMASAMGIRTPGWTR
jgi:branched-subunit amino acid ABC-type transport system permease component